MSGKELQDVVVKACLKGIDVAFDTYYKMSGEVWLDDAPEYFVVCGIARSLSECRQYVGYVTLEDHVKETMKYAHAVSVGAPKQSLRKNGRSDIVVWNTDE